MAAIEIAHELHLSKISPHLPKVFVHVDAQDLMVITWALDGNMGWSCSVTTTTTLEKSTNSALM